MKHKKKVKKKNIFGTSDRPRLAVYKSNKAFYGQVINDMKGHTLAAIDTRKLDGKLVERVKKAAELLAVQATKKEIKKITYDRRNYRYHGLVKIFFDAFANKLATN